MLKGNAIKQLRNPFHQCATIPHSLRTPQILVKIDIFFLLKRKSKDIDILVLGSGIDVAKNIAKQIDEKIQVAVFLRTIISSDSVVRKGSRKAKPFFLEARPLRPYPLA